MGVDDGAEFGRVSMSGKRSAATSAGTARMTWSSTPTDTDLSAEAKPDNAIAFNPDLAEAMSVQDLARPRDSIWRPPDPRGFPTAPHGNSGVQTSAARPNVSAKTDPAVACRSGFRLGIQGRDAKRRQRRFWKIVLSTLRLSARVAVTGARQLEMHRGNQWTGSGDATIAGEQPPGKSPFSRPYRPALS